MDSFLGVISFFLDHEPPTLLFFFFHLLPLRSLPPCPLPQDSSFITIYVSHQFILSGGLTGGLTGYITGNRRAVFVKVTSSERFME